jgi:hypothetical protein
MDTIANFARVSEGFVSYKFSILVKFIEMVIKMSKSDDRWAIYGKLIDQIAEKLVAYQEAEKQLKTIEKQGDKAAIAYQTTVANNARNALLWLTLHYAHGVQFTADGDKETIASTGFETKKTGARASVSSLEDLKNPYIEYGDVKSATIIIGCDVVSNAKFYEIEVEYDFSGVYLSLATVTTCKSVHSNLESGKVARFRMRACGTKNLVGNWFVFDPIVCPLKTVQPMSKKT